MDLGWKSFRPRIEPTSGVNSGGSTGSVDAA